MEVRLMRANGLRFPALEAGTGGRPLLIVHGFVGAKEDWAPHVDRLAGAGWHVVVPDLRGHGDADKPDSRDDYTLRAYTADVVAIADAMDWDRFVLLGHSMGGMIAQHVALDHADRLVALVLQDTSHGVPDGIAPDLVALAKATVAEGGTDALVSVQEGVDGPFDTPADTRMRQTVPGYAEQSDRNTRVASDVMWLAMADELLAQPDRLDRLADIAIPTLVVAGVQDRAFVNQCRRIAAAIPTARLVVLDDAGHSPHREAADAWWAAVSNFLYDIAAATTPAGRVLE